MTDPTTTADLPIGASEADVLEQRATIDWPERPEDPGTAAHGRVTDTIADEGDLLEQTQIAGPGVDDEYPHPERTYG